MANAGVALQAGRLTRLDPGPPSGAGPAAGQRPPAGRALPTAFSAFRPDSVAPWFRLDARVAYRLGPWLRLGVQGTNLMDSEGYLVKTADYPFDFRIEGLRVLATLELTARLGP